MISIKSVFIYFLISSLECFCFNLVETNNLIDIDTNYYINELCSNDYDCILIEGRFCISGICRCDVNYRVDIENYICEHFQCKNNTECQVYDDNRVCESSRCVCRQGYEVNHEKNMCL